MREEVYEMLRELIVDGTLKPSEKMRDKELAGALGVSRTPVREALRRLEDEGLVESAANRWTRVSSVDISEAKSIYPIIWSLEALAISLAESRIGGAEIEEMAEINARLERALSKRKAVEASESDRAFHEVFVRRSGSEDLIKILNELKMRLRRLEVLYFGGCVVAGKSVAEHEEILEALRSKDYVWAAAAVEANWKESLKRIFTQHAAGPAQDIAPSTSAS
ncbi:MAG: GntR family transcriptional regulator [Rubrobacteraceae bacterium]